MGSGVWGEVREGCGREECGSSADWCPVLYADRALSFRATLQPILLHSTHTLSTNVLPRDITSSQWCHCQILTMRVHIIHTGSYNRTMPAKNNNMTKGFFVVSAELDRALKNLSRLQLQQKY